MALVLDQFAHGRKRSSAKPLTVRSHTQTAAHDVKFASPEMKMACSVTLQAIDLLVGARGWEPSTARTPYEPALNNINQLSAFRLTKPPKNTS